MDNAAQDAYNHHIYTDYWPIDARINSTPHN